MDKLAQYVQSYQTSYARAIIFHTLQGLKWGSLNVIYVNQEGKKESVEFGSKDKHTLEATVAVKDDKLWWRLCSNMDLGMSEGFMLDEIECDNLVALFTIYIRNKEVLGVGSFLLQIIPRLQRVLFYKSNTVANALQNAISHYDTSNDLFAGFLSDDMNYSCPIWTDNSDGTESLESAQYRKVHNIIQKANIQASDYVLDIGCGWGQLAIEAVRLTGCRVRGVTLSAEQKHLAEEKIREAGFSERIEIVLCDYRQIVPIPGGYDKIVSVEMLEHVGQDHMKTFFETITKLLKPDVGKMVVQVITVTHERHDSKANIDTFIDRYIFPGGYLPSAHIVLDAIHRGSKGELEVRNVQSIGPHYIRALRLWREKFLANWEAVIKPSFTRGEQSKISASDVELEQVKKKWEYYFCYCEAGFRTNMLGDCVITAEFKESRDPFAGVPL